MTKPTRTGRPYRRLRDQVLASSGGVCHLCGKPPTLHDPLVVDHVIPIARGGQSVPENLRAAHKSCNGAKSAALRLKPKPKSMWSGSWADRKQAAEEWMRRHGKTAW